MKRIILALSCLLAAGCGPAPADGWRRANGDETRRYQRALTALEAVKPGLAHLSEQLVLAEGQPLLIEQSLDAAGQGQRISATLALEPSPVALWEQVRRVQGAEVVESSDTRASRFWRLLSPRWPGPWTDGRWVCVLTQRRQLRGWDGGEVREFWARGLDAPGRGWSSSSGKDVLLISTDAYLPQSEAPDLGQGSHRTLDLAAMRKALQDRLKASDLLREALGSLRGGAQL